MITAKMQVKVDFYTQGTWCWMGDVDAKGENIDVLIGSGEARCFGVVIAEVHGYEGVRSEGRVLAKLKMMVRELARD